MSDIEIELRTVTLTLCELCLSGAGGECHTPGCALYLNRAPDCPVHSEDHRGEVADAFHRGFTAGLRAFAQGNS